MTPAFNAVKIESMQMMAISNLERKTDGVIDNVDDVMSNKFQGGLTEDEE